MKRPLLALVLFCLSHDLFSQNLMLLVEHRSELKQKVMIHDMVEIKLKGPRDGNQYWVGRVTNISNVALWLDTFQIQFDDILRIGPYQGQGNVIRGTGVLGGLAFIVMGSSRMINKEFNKDYDKPLGITMVFSGISMILSNVYLIRPTYRVREEDTFKVVNCANL